jgi:O-antigen/teichoic acid export membrane protein
VATPTSAASESILTGTAHEATRKQIRGSSLLLAGRFLSLGINFAIQVLIVRYLSKEAYGAFAYTLALVSLGVSLATFGLDRSITRFVPIYDEEKEYDKLWGTIVMVTGTILSISLGLVLLVYGLQNLLTGSLISDEQAISLLLIMILLVPVLALDNLMLGLFAVMAKPRAIFFRKNVVGPMLRLAVVLLLVLSGAGVEFLAAGFVVTGALAVSIYTAFLVKTIQQQGLLERFSLKGLDMPGREVFGFTVPLFASDLLYMVMNTSDVILLGHYWGAEAVGALRVILPAAHLNLIVMGSFTLLFTPVAARLFSRGDREGIRHLYWQTTAWIAVLSFPIFAITFSLSQPLTVLLFGERYESSAKYLTLLALAYYFNAALGLNGLTLKVFGKVRFIVLISVAAALTNLALAFLLIPRHGALGAAVATSSTLVVHNILKQWGLKRGTGIGLFQREDAVVYVSIVLTAAALLILYWLAHPPVWLAFPLAAVGSLIVVLSSRRVLRTGETFPELARFRIIRLIVGR